MTGRTVTAALLCAALLGGSGCVARSTPVAGTPTPTPVHHRRIKLELTAVAAAYSRAQAITPQAPWTARFYGVRVQGVRTNRRVVAMTFDDGPTVETTRIVDDLSAASDHATFFMIGTHITTAAVDDVVAHGDEPANHSWDHPNLHYVSSKESSEEIGLQSQRIDAITGTPPIWFRSPFDRAWTKEIAEIQRHGLLYADFSVNTHDWRPDVSDAEVMAQVHDELHPGGIVVMHEGIPHTVAILPRVLSYIRSRGYKVVTLTALAQLGPPIGPPLTEESNPKEVVPFDIHL